MYKAIILHRYKGRKPFVKNAHETGNAPDGCTGEDGLTGGMAGAAGLLAEATHVSGVLHALPLARPVGAVLVVVGTLLACWEFCTEM